MHDPFDERIALARALTEQRRFAEAITLFDWLCERYPDRAAAIVDSANAYSRVFDYAGVLKRFSNVESRAAVPGDVWLAMAEISQRLRRPEWAANYFSRAISVPAAPAEAFGLFALHLEHTNDVDRADEIVERGLKIDPNNPSCLLAKIRLLRRRKQLDAAMTAAQYLIDRKQQPDRTKVSAFFELALICDALGDCAGAIGALELGKQLRARLPEFAMFQTRAISAEQIHHRFLTTLDSDYFKKSAAWQPQSPAKLVLLAGHPRSGTTLLEQVLDSHSQIISAEETPVFGLSVNDPFLRELSGPSLCESALHMPIHRLETFRQSYFSTMQSVLDQPIGDRWLMDKNPSVTDCIPIFSRVFPEARYLIALRDPRDVVLSCYFQDLPINDVSVHFQSLAQTAIRYANTMAMWLLARENMDQRRWTEVRYESLVTDLPGETQRVMEALKLTPQPSQLHPNLHAQQRSVQSPTYAQVTQPVHARAVGRWKRYAPWLAAATPTLETFIEAFDY